MGPGWRAASRENETKKADERLKKNMQKVVGIHDG